MQPKLLLPLAAAALVLTVPAAADAAVTTQLNGTTLTVTGDGADDNVTIGVNNAGLLTHNFGGDATDFDPVTPGAQTLPSNDTIAVTLNLGAGNDTANLSAANLANSTINGDAGDDIITGSDNADAIDGGDGNDRITGFRGNDVVHGDAGNDTMIWNNGDGTDDDLGDAGVDETLITAGTANDQMTVKPQGTGTRFDRINAPFGINIDNTVERLSITSFSGNDSLATDPGVALPMVIDAGSGDDTISTGDGADVVNGGDGNDTLNGAGGGDRLIGDRGADTVSGGEGDDTTVWNNGDGSDVMNGDGGVDRVETNLGAGNDVSTLKPENGRVRYDRTSAGAFSLSIAGAEFFALNSLGGDDTLTTTATGLPVIADGGAGNDVFNVREGERGHYFGGSGSDSATIDADDTTVDVESVSTPEPQPPAPMPGTPTLEKQAKVKKGVAALKLACPAGTSGCTGTITLTYKARRIGRTRYTLMAGESKTLKVKLAKRPGKRKPLTVTARVSSAAGPDRLQRLKLVL